MGSVFRYWLSVIVLCATFASARAAADDIAFDAYSPLSSNAEIARRMLTPLSYRRMQPHFSELREQAIDLSKEKFALRVPSGAAPANGYGLIVFIAPWKEASLPRDWPRVLDRYGLIFVSAADSGNDAGILERRVPLALLGYENVRRRYPLDADRVYVGGLSGGSRVALRVALAYPDVFRGAVLNAGSDPIGEGQVFVPPANLFRRFQEATRLVFVTGQRDEMNLHGDAVSRTSLQDRCVFGLSTETMPRRGHEIADPAGLAAALKDLDKPAQVDAEKLAECRARLQGELDADVAEATAAIDGGDRTAAAKAIDVIDLRYGGMAARAIDVLQGRFAPQH